MLNLQGDVIAVLDSSGGYAAWYVYDAWGKVLTVRGTDTALANANPIRYRGYYYDSETGFYYLGSRYYDPTIKRFINADSAGLVTANPYSLTDKNYFSYCDNNPVSRKDDGGMLWAEAAIGAVIGGIFGGVSAAITGGSVLEGMATGAISGGLTGAASTASVALGAVAGAVTAFWAYNETSTSPNIGGAIVASVCGAASGAIGGLVSVKSYGVIATTTVSYCSGLATSSLSMVGTTAMDSRGKRNFSGTSTKNNKIKERFRSLNRRYTTKYRNSRQLRYKRTSALSR